MEPRILNPWIRRVPKHVNQQKEEREKNELIIILFIVPSDRKREREMCKHVDSTEV